MIANRAFVVRAVREFNRLSPDELAAKVAAVPGTNLAVLRDAARALGRTGDLLPSDVALVERVVTTEIERRWA